MNRSDGAHECEEFQAKVRQRRGGVAKRSDKTLKKL
jgi:hypothetical protein